MKPKPFFRAFALSLAIALPAFSQSRVPAYISYQATVTDDSGALIAPTAPEDRTVEVRIYNASTGGTVIFAESHLAAVYQGRLSLILGDGTEILDESNDPVGLISDLSELFDGSSLRYVEITLIDDSDSAQVFTPRQRIVSTPVALRAKTAEKALAVEDDSVTSASIANGSISGADIANDTIKGNNLGANSVGGYHILNGTIQSDKLASDAITSDNIQNGTITSADIKDRSISYLDIQEETIGWGEIKDGRVRSQEIADNTITSDDIANNAVRSEEILDNSITKSDIGTGAVWSDEIRDGTITSVDINTETWHSRQVKAVRPDSMGDLRVRRSL
ncbi:hypothetical protein ACFSYE_05555, partial [Roseibacillus ishigakijimensis]